MDKSVSTPSSQSQRLRALSTAGVSRALRARDSVAGRLHDRYSIVVALLVAAFALMLVWNVAHYPAGHGMDAIAHFRYVHALQEYHRPPTPKEAWTAGAPPLFHTAAAVIESTSKYIGAPGGDRTARKLVQLFNVLLGVGLALVTFLIARELFPASRIAQITALAFVALSPPVTRTVVMYHGQTLAAFLSTAGLYVVVRALVRHEPTVRAGALAGVLLGLGVLTRQFVLGTVAAMCVALAAYFAFTRRREAFRMGAALVLPVVLLSAPWFIYQQVLYGSPVFIPEWRQEAKPGKPFFARQPPEFYLGRPFRTVFTKPYRPAYANRMPQIVYTDWWGDYFLYYEVPSSLRFSGNAPGRLPGGRLPEPYHTARVTQSYVGLAPTLVMLAGVIGMAWAGVRRRSAAILAVPAMVAVLGAQALVFFINWPTVDGDTMKATYLLNGVPPLALAAGWALWRLRERSPIVFRLGAAVLLGAALFDVQFLWIHQSIGQLDRQWAGS